MLLQELLEQVCLALALHRVEGVGDSVDWLGARDFHRDGVVQHFHGQVADFCGHCR